jgi:glycosyltransferase involved in cell wall biosynthesis
MTKLLHISANTYPPLDGKHHHTKNIWEELAKGFDEYHILARSETNRYSFSKERNIYLHLVPRITKKSKIFFFTSFWIFYIIKKYKITHLLSQCPIVGGFTASLASKFFKIPLMVEIHGEEYFRFLDKKHFIVKIMNFTFKQVKKIRSLNKEMTEKLLKFNISKEKIIEIPNRVNLKIFYKQKNDFSIQDTIKLISVGRFVWEKDYLNLIDFLYNASLNFHLTLVGGGELKEQYINYLEEHKIEDKVTLIDWIEQDKLVDLIVNSDIYIQSSVSEGMPRTIVEAMALQMPIISTDVGSILGVLENNKNALVIKSNSNEELKQAIETLINNDNLREEIAKQAYKDVLEKYEWNRVFEIYRNELKSMKYENP